MALKFDLLQGSGEVQGHGRVPHSDFLDSLKGNPHNHTVEKEIDRIVGELKQVFSRYGMDEAKQRAFLADVFSKAIHAEAPLIPVTAPSLWMDRADRKETPPDFIKRVYAPWLGNGLTRVDILHRDKQLYFAFHRWLTSNPMPADLDLPTREQVNDRKLQELGVTAENPSVRPDVAPDLRERMRLNNIAHRRFG
jgi:hypothetical protein